MKRRLLAAVSILLTACSKPESKSRSFMQQPSQEKAVFARFVQLPHDPISVKFQTADLSPPGGFGPSDWTLAAVITFSPNDLQSLLPEMKSASTSDLDQTSLLKRFPWLQAELGSGPLPQSYEPTPFLRSPLNNGTAFLLSGNRVLLILSTS